jgi:hypothetical protein
MFRLTNPRRLRRKSRVSTAGARARLQRSLKADPIALFSHELRTPLHGLSGMLELLGQSDLSEHQQHLVDAMQRCSRSLASMLNGAIEIPGHNSSSTQTPVSQFDLAGKLEDIIAIYQGWATTRSVELSYSICADTPGVVSADSGRLRQVLNNLLSNAIKYCPGGTVMINVSCRQHEPSLLQFRVSDNGNGISRAVRHPETENYSSSGLGLNISRALVKAVGGRLNISGNAGDGTCCSFTFPVTPVSRNPGIALARSKLLNRGCVLVIMGERTRESVCCHLQRWGIRHLAKKSASCLRGAGRPHDEIDTVILDLAAVSNAPREELHIIHQHRPSIPIAVLLPFASKPGRWADMEGVTVIHKPITRGGLAAWLIACSLRESNRGTGD